METNENFDLTKISPVNLTKKMYLPILVSLVIANVGTFYETVLIGQLLGVSRLVAISGVLFVIIYTIETVFSAIVEAVQVYLTNNAISIEDKSNLFGIFIIGTLIGLFTCALVYIILQLSINKLLTFGNVPRNIHIFSTEYLKWYYFCMPPVVIMMVLCGILRVYGFTRYSTFLSVVSFIIFIIVSTIEFTVHGASVDGLGISKLTSKVITLLLTLIISYRKLFKGISKPRIGKELLKKLIQDSIMLSISMFTLYIMDIFIYEEANKYGLIEGAVLSIVQSVQAVYLLFIYSLEEIAIIHLSAKYGVKDYQGISGNIKEYKRLFFIVLFILSIFIFIFSKQIVGIYNSNHEVIVQGSRCLKLVAIVWLLYTKSILWYDCLDACDGKKILTISTILTYVPGIFLLKYLLIRFNLPFEFVAIIDPLAMVFCGTAYRVLFNIGFKGLIKNEKKILKTSNVAD